MIEKRHYPMPEGMIEMFESGMDRPQPDWVDILPDKPALNLGAGYKYLAGTFAIGAEQGWWAGSPLPFDDGGCGGIFTYHFFEHLGKDIFFDVLRECERVLAVGAPLNVVVPHYQSEGAFHDLDHKQFFTESTWKNLMHNTYYDGTMPRTWSFDIGLNLIIGLNSRNLSLFTQLIRRD